MVNALLTLEKLQTIRIVVNKGDLPAQLGALQELAFLKIDYWCMISKLPTNWGRDWRNLWYLDIRQYVSAEGSSQDVGCGITGKLPVVWGSQMPSLQVLDLSGNRLAGPLPPEYEGMNNLQKVYLQNNQLSYQIPSTWSKLPLTALDLSGNRLEGAVPLSFASISVQERLEVLRLDDNRNLAGCVPLASFTTLTYSNTRITGLCASTRLEIEEAQEAAIKTMLKPLFNADGQNWTAVINPFLQRATMLPELNDWTIQGQTTTVIPHNDARGSLTMTLTIIEGTTYITAIKSTGAGLDLTVLPGFIAALPRLEAFSCIGCNYNAANKTASSLPPELATRVHSYFKTLTLASSKLVGQLPAAWGRLQHLQELQLHENALTGGLPDALADMAALLHLNINDNSIKGQLPAAWGLGSVPSGFRLDANGNEGLTGNIPDSWARFTGYLKLMRTNITGCVPDQLVYSVYKDEPNDPCSGISPEVEALLSLQQVIDPEGSALSSWDPMTTGIIPAPGLIAPRHCRSWVGVKCNSINQVVELDLSDMASEGLNPRSPLKLSNLVQHLAKLPALQVLKLHSNAGLLKGSSIPAELNQLKQLRHLDLSKSALSGPLPELLASLLSLEHLDLSSNADVNGALPELWAGMSGLKFLDLSGCGISGKLPLAWGALQQLQVFRAANTRISGALLPEWGILGSLRELVMTNAQLTGPVPGQWGDAAAMQAAAVKVLAAVQQAVAKAESTAGTNTGTVSVTSDAAASKAVLQQAVTSLSGALSGGAEGRAATAASSSGSGLGLTQLQVLRLRGNKLSGILPDTFSELVQLRDVDLSFNSITGQLPMKWATLSQLKKLDLSRNKITGSLPPYWARLTLLEVLDLSNNVLTGRLQPTWASLANVRHLDLSNNRLSGDISNVWFSLKSAARLDLANNLFTGEFPATWGIMADRSTHKLQSLFLSDLPCMNQGTLQRTVFKSGIAQGGYVKVVLTCCSVSAQKKAKLCKL